MRIWLLVGALFVFGILSISLASSISSTNYAIRSPSVGDGASNNLSSESFSLKAVIGEIAGAISSVSQKINLGFFYTAKGDLDAPELTVIVPVNGSRFNNSEVIFNVSSSEVVDWCGLSLDGAENVSMDLYPDSLGANYTNSSMSEGFHSFVIYCNDTTGNMGSVSGSDILVDSVYPLIEFGEGTDSDEAVLSRSQVNVNVNVNDATSNVSTFIDWDNSLVSWWRMDDVEGSILVDYTGRNNGTIVGAEQTDAGYFGKGMSFDGSGTVDGVVHGDQITVPESVTNTNNYPEGGTYSIWLYVNHGAVNRMSLFRGGSTIRHIEIYSSSKYFRTEAALQNGYSFGTGNFPDDVRGVWSHFVIVFANDEANRPVRWYQNGELFHTGSMDGGTFPGTEYFSFGSIGRSTGTETYNYANSFNGSIDDVMIFNRSLSAEEIVALYANTSSRYLSHNFTGLSDGSSHTFKAYTQDLAGNVNSTEEREVTIDLASDCDFDNDYTLISNLTCAGNITIHEGATLSSGGYGITIGGYANVWGTMNLTAGSVLNFTSTAGFFGDSNGTLNSIGEGSDRVLITGNSGWNFYTDMNVTGNYSTFEFMNWFRTYEWRTDGIKPSAGFEYCVFKNATSDDVVYFETDYAEVFNNNVIHTNSGNSYGLYLDSDDSLDTVVNLTIYGPSPNIRIHGERWEFINSSFGEVNFIVDQDSSIVSKNHNNVLNDYIIWPGNGSFTKSDITNDFGAGANLTIRKDMSGDPVVFRIDEDAELYKWHIPEYLGGDQADYRLEFYPGVTVTFDDTSGAGFIKHTTGYGTTEVTTYMNGTSDNWITFTSASGKNPTNHWIGWDSNFDTAGKWEYLLVQGHTTWAAHGADVSVDNSIFEGASSYGLFLRDARGPYSNLIVRDSDYGFRKYSWGNITNLTVENITGSNPHVRINYMSHSPLEFVNSSFDETRVSYGTQYRNLSMISKNHNNVAGDYLIGVKTALTNGEQNYLKKSQITEDFDSTDNVTILQGNFIIDEAWDYNSMSVNNSNLTYAYSDVDSEINYYKNGGNITIDGVTLTTSDSYYGGVAIMDNTTDSFHDGSYYIDYAINGGLWNVTSAAFNLPPSDPNVSIEFSGEENVTTEDVYCNATVIDPDGDNMTVSVRWYLNGGLEDTLNYTSIENGTAFGAVLLSGNTTKYDNWSCEMKLYDDYVSSNWVMSKNLTVLNALPVVTLISPENQETTQNRMPTFNWSGFDADEDILEYEFNLVSEMDGGGYLCTDNRNEDSLETSNYTPESVLKCLWDNNNYYNWSVRASDDSGLTWGEWSENFTLKIEANITIYLDVRSIDFGIGALNATNDTTDDSPEPLLLENLGNALVNVTVNSTNLWSKFLTDSNYYRFKVDWFSGQFGAFNYSASQTEWFNVPISGNVLAIDKLNYEENNNSAEIDIGIRVPNDEPQGQKSATVIFTSRLRE